MCLSSDNVSYGTTTSACTASYIARWNTLVVIPYDIMSTEIHWLWYRIAHCQLKYTGNGTAYHIARWNTLITVPFTWQCVMRYHNQRISPDNASYGTMTSAFHLAMCHAVPRPVQHSNISYSTTRNTLVVVPHSTLSAEIYWLWYRMTYCQVKYTGCGTVRHIARLHWSWYRMTHCQLKGTARCTSLRISPDNMSYGITTSIFQLAMCYTVPQPVYFTWQCAMRYHKQCLSHDNVSCGTTTNVFHLTMYHMDITLPGEIHWLWYRIANCQLKYTGCVTAWHIGRCKALVVVQHSTLPGEIHSLLYNQYFSAGNVLYGTTTSVFHLAMRYAVP
jgi:hypothetical protein